MGNKVTSVCDKSIEMNNKKELLIVSIMMVIGTFLFLLCSPLNPFGSGCSDTDSSVFRTVALMMERGYIPYKDSFDHKGPLLFILNYLGNRISATSGIWVIEYIFLMAAVSAMYRIARLFCNLWQSVFFVVVSMILLIPYFEKGNFSEEYAMTFIAISLFVFVDYFKNNKITRIRLLLCGATFAGTLLLRPNMIALWCVMCLAVLIKSCKDKSIKELFSFIGWFILGVVIVVGPIAVWLWKNGALQYCWYDYVTFNNQYVSSEDGRSLLSARCSAYVYFAATPIYLISVLLQLLLSFMKRNTLNIAYLMLLIVSPLFICVSGHTYAHYGIILVPLVVYPLASALHAVNAQKSKLVSDSIILISKITVLIVIAFNAYLAVDYLVGFISSNKIVEVYTADEMNEICNILDENGIGEDEAISVYGNWDLVYVMSTRPHATDYSYQFPIGEVMPSIMDDYMKQMQEELPRVVVVQSGCYDNNIDAFICDNDYELIWTSHYLRWGEDGNLEDPAQLYLRQY